MNKIIDLLPYLKGTSKLPISSPDDVEQLLSDWNLHIVSNTLTSFITTELGIDFGSQITTDLNVVSQLERLMRLNPLIISPEYHTPHQLGWIVRFSVGASQELVSTPEFYSEIYARCFSLLLFNRLTTDLMQK